MNTEKGNTIKAIKEQRKAPQHVVEQVKNYNKIKKQILEILKESSLTIPQLAEKTGLSEKDTLFYVMSLQKFGFVVPDGLTDMDDFYFYKTKQQ